MPMLNTVYLRRKNKVILTAGTSNISNQLMATMLKNLESLGYTLSQEVMKVLASVDQQVFLHFYEECIETLQKMVGAHVRYKPMYPNFPEQVMEAEQSELYINAVIHYLTLDLPVSEVRKRLPLLKQSKLRVIQLGTEEEVLQIATRLVAAKTSLSPQDKEDLAVIIQHFDDTSEWLPEDIPFKETLAWLASQLYKHDKLPILFLDHKLRTATDVLRFVTALSDGDISLATNTKYRKLRRPERRLILRLLERCPNLAEEMHRYVNRWKRIGEILHPFEYKQQFPNAAEAFDILRNNKKIDTFHSKLELALLSQDADEAGKLLEERPGEFARRLDHLLRISTEPELVLARFAIVAPQVSTPVLLQVMNHFQKRDLYGDLRTFFPKGIVAKVYALPNRLPRLADALAADVAKLCEQLLIERFRKLPSLGKVYIDPQLDEYLVPFSQRSASKALRTIVRGSRLPIPAGNTIRFFTWWKEGKVNDKNTGRVDIDLSAVMYDSEWKYMEHISYTNLKSDDYRAYHSGDIVSAPQGACEFIDIDIPSVLAFGGRYVVMSLNAFTEHPFCNLPECFVGWMMRQRPKSGEIFEPRTVVDKVDLAADTTICIPVILDLYERKVIWTDIALKAHPYYYNNVEGNSGGMTLMGKALTTLMKPSLHQLFTLHAKARGTIVEQAETAEQIFSVHEGITPFDVEQIIAEYL